MKGKNPIKFFIAWVVARFAVLKDKWNHRPLYPEYELMPTALIVFFAFCWGSISWGAQHVLTEVGPDFINVASGIPVTAWGVKGWLLGLILAVIACVCFGTFLLFHRCVELIGGRWFK